MHNQVLTLQASYKLSLAQIEQAQADLPYYQTAFKRQQDLVATGAASKATFDQAQHDLEAAQQKVAVAKAQAQAMLAQLGGDPNQPIEKNPFYLQAKSGVDNAQRDLNDTIVARRSTASSPMSTRFRSAPICRRRSRPSAWSRRPMSGSRRARRKPS